MGAMRQAQTGNLGVLPGPPGTGFENTFFAQAYDVRSDAPVEAATIYIQRHSHTRLHHYLQ
jgi:hypothetical protein